MYFGAIPPEDSFIQIAHYQNYTDSSGRPMRKYYPTKVGPVIFGNGKGWIAWGAVTGGAYLFKGAAMAAMVGLPALVALGFASAMGGNPMFQTTSGLVFKRKT